VDNGATLNNGANTITNSGTMNVDGAVTTSEIASSGTYNQGTTGNVTGDVTNTGARGSQSTTT